MAKTPAWQRKEGKSKSGGLNRKGIASYRRANPGSKLKMAVTEKNPKGKRAARRKSFCARMKGMKRKLTSAKTARDPNSRINMSKRLEKLADQMINLTPEESQKLALIVRAKLMPEIAKQQQQGLLQQANNPMMQQMGRRPNMQMQMPNARMAAQQGLLRQ